MPRVEKCPQFRLPWLSYDPMKYKIGQHLHSEKKLLPRNDSAMTSD